MRRNNILKILSSITIGAGIVFLLNAYARSQIYHNGSFIRLFPPHVINNFKSLDIGFDSYYFAGTTENDIYLGNYTAPAKMLIISKDLAAKRLIDLSIPDSIKLNWARAKVLLNDQKLYIGEGNSPLMLYKVIPAGQLSVVSMDSLHFDHDWVPLSEHSYIVRKYDSARKQNILVKKLTGHTVMIVSNGVLEKQLDGKFCTDGMLLFDNYNSRLLYMYYYRNQFIVLDTNLHILAKYKTIDTTNKVSITLDTIYSENRVTFSSPPGIVNKRATLSNKLLFINSALKASNEDEQLNNQDNDIDIYRLDNGNYAFSFTLPAFRKQKLSSMIVSGNMLFGIYDSYLISFELNLQKL